MSFNISAHNGILADSHGTAEFCLFIDTVFDSVNGSSIFSKDGKIMRSAIKEDSPHVAFWYDAIAVFKSMKFVDKLTGRQSVPPCINNWIETLNGFITLWNILKKNFQMKFLIPRNINQDPLECFFGNIRSHGHRNINPSSIQFVSSFKTLLINNFSSVKSIGSNCESDDCSVLDNLKSFITGPIVKNCSDDLLNLPLLILDNTIEKSNINIFTFGYVGGYIVRSILNSIKRCECCINELTLQHITNALIKARSYTRYSLKNPSENFEKLLEQMFVVLSHYTPLFCHLPCISQKLHLILEINIEFNFSCPVHNLKEHIKKKVVDFYLFSYFKRINLILKGKISSTNDDVIKQMAVDYFNKNRTRKLKINKLKSGSIQ